MYYNIWQDLLSLVKENFMSKSEISETDFIGDEDKASLKRIYSLKDYPKNLIWEPTHRHKTELNIENNIEEFSYIASRKALLFNLFGNDKTTIKRNIFGLFPGEYKVNYMPRVPVIKGKNLNINYDALLHNVRDREMVVARLRFLEWIILGNDSIKEQYMDSSNYFSKEAGMVFPGVIKKLLSVCSNDGMAYTGKFSNFDALHVIKELIAAYNLLEVYNKNLKLRKLIIADIYWKPVFYEKLDQYAGRVFVKEKNIIKEANEMQEIIKPVVTLFREKFDVLPEIKCMDFWSMLHVQDKSQKELDWMRRYIV